MPKAKAPPNDADLFQLDTEGSHAVRERLQKSLGAPKLKRKILKSEEVLQNTSSMPALVGRTRPGETSSQRERRRVGWDKKLAQRVKAVGHRKRSGRGLADLDTNDKSGQELSLAVAEAGSYDLWNAPQASSSKVHTPATIGKHQAIPNDLLPAAVTMPHPGASYNPTASAHQALLAEALQEAEKEEIEKSRLRAIKEAADAAREANTRELWEAAEAQVGSGSEPDEPEEVREEVITKQKKPKTAKEKRRRAENLLREKLAAQQRQLIKAQRRAIATLPSTLSALSASQKEALQAKQAKDAAFQRRLAERGLSKLRSGKHVVPAAFPDYQLEEDLAEGLRSLKSEGSLWKDYKQSMMQRGRLEPAAEVRRERKRKGRSTKMVERFDFKHYVA